jgi:hypothetical protein
VDVIAKLLCTLPPLPHGVLHCPPAFAVSYQIRFRSATQAIVPVTIQLSGCQEIHGTGLVRWAAQTPSFWSNLGKAAGVPNSGRETFSSVR